MRNAECGVRNAEGSEEMGRADSAFRIPHSAFSSHSCLDVILDITHLIRLFTADGVAAIALLL
jgi:hypothetical protein